MESVIKGSSSRWSSDSSPGQLLVINSGVKNSTPIPIHHVYLTCDLIFYMSRLIVQVSPHCPHLYFLNSFARFWLITHHANRSANPVPVPMSTTFSKYQWQRKRTVDDRKIRCNNVIGFFHQDCHIDDEEESYLFGLHQERVQEKNNSLMSSMSVKGNNVVTT